MCTHKIFLFFFISFSSSSMVLASAGPCVVAKSSSTCIRKSHSSACEQNGCLFQVPLSLYQKLTVFA